MQGSRLLPNKVPKATQLLDNIKKASEEKKSDSESRNNKIIAIDKLFSILFEQYSSLKINEKNHKEKFRKFTKNKQSIASLQGEFTKMVGPQDKKARRYKVVSDTDYQQLLKIEHALENLQEWIRPELDKRQKAEPKKVSKPSPASAPEYKRLPKGRKSHKKALQKDAAIDPEQANEIAAEIKTASDKQFNETVVERIATEKMLASSAQELNLDVEDKIELNMSLDALEPGLFSSASTFFPAMNKLLSESREVDAGLRIALGGNSNWSCTLFEDPKPAPRVIKDGQLIAVSISTPTPSKSYSSDW